MKLPRWLATKAKCCQELVIGNRAEYRPACCRCRYSPELPVNLPVHHGTWAVRRFVLHIDVQPERRLGGLTVEAFCQNSTVISVVGVSCESELPDLHQVVGAIK